uniref:RIN4 pathogenic type III effector avirulence factor Avr cleavage site domain-containing protein n=1 Tax=Brassica campestris TaxID=3711 RepID=M4EKB6_BRACM
MATENKGRPLPKFGEWDVNNPASAEGFTVIFSKASDEKKTKKASGAVPNSQRNQNSDQNNHHDSQNSKPKIANLILCSLSRRNGFASVDSCLLLKNPRIMKLNKVNPQEATHLSRLDPIHLQTEAPINVEREDQTCIFKLFPRVPVPPHLVDVSDDEDV